MKRFFPALIFVLALLWLASSWLPPKSAADEVNRASFGKIPVLVGGRVKPLDTVARNSLLILQGRERVSSPEISEQFARRCSGSPTSLFQPARPGAIEYPVFVIQNAEVLGLFGWEQSDRKYFSFAELSPFLKQIDEQGEQSEKLQSVQRSAYQNAIFNLRNALVLYQRLKNSVQPEGAANFEAELQAFESAIPDAAMEARQRETGASVDQAKLDAVAELIQRYQTLAEMAYVLAVPPPQPRGEWHSIGESLVQSITKPKVDPVARMYAQIGDAYRGNNPSLFNQHVDVLAGVLAQEQPDASKRTSFEFLFNRVDPFSQSMVLYVLAFLLACGSWLGWNRPLNRSAFYLLLLALAVHTFGLVSRMYLQERPPVTNLYSSAIFIGWGAVIVSLILERIFPRWDWRGLRWRDWLHHPDHRASSGGQRRHPGDVASRPRHQHLAGDSRGRHHDRLRRHVSGRHARHHLHRSRRLHALAEKGDGRFASRA